MDQRPNAKELLDEIRRKGNLPALESNVTEVCSVTEDSETSYADLTGVIMRDAALASSILTLANSAAYGGIEPVRTISAAVLRLGFQKIRALTLGLAIFRQVGQNLRTADLYRLYAGTYFAGTLAMSLLRKLDQANPEEGFVAGLLEQFPRLVLAQSFPTQYREMEQLVATQELTVNEACRKVFGIEYEALRTGLADTWGLPDRLCKPSDRGKEAAESMRLIREASGMADMLFGNAKGGAEALAEAESRVGELLGDSKFEFSGLLKTISEEDDNIRRFFKLTPQDVEMMVKIVEWGKVSAAQVAATLSFSPEQQEIPWDSEEPEIAIGHYLTELMRSSRRGADINHLLLTAQEAAFRCLRPTHVILALLDSQRKSLRGRFHAGVRGKINAAILQTDMSQKDSPLVRCLHAAGPVRTDAREAGWDPALVKELQMKHVLMAPVIAFGRPIGLHLLVRSGDPPFSVQEKTWLEAIDGHLATGFERQK